MLGGRITGFGTSRPSIFFSTGRLRCYPNTGTEHPGALMRSRTMIWTACFTIPRPRRGSVEHSGRLRSYLSDLQQKRTCGSTDNCPTPKDRLAEIFGEMHSRRCGHLLSQSQPCSTGLPAEGINRLLTRRLRVTGSITFALRRIAGGFIAGETRRLIE